MNAYRHPRNPSLRVALAALATAFPGVAFTVEKTRRGRRIAWTGPPSITEAHGIAPSWLRPRDVTGFDRRPTREELDALTEQWRREDAARQAAEPARKAAAKAAALAKRRATLTDRANTLATLAGRYPGTAFATVRERGTDYVRWTGGPEYEHVASLLRIPSWRCQRADSPEDIAARATLATEAERLRCDAIAAAVAAAQADEATRERSRAARLDAERCQIPLPLACRARCAAVEWLPQEFLDSVEPPDDFT